MRISAGVSYVGPEKAAIDAAVQKIVEFVVASAFKSLVGDRCRLFVRDLLKFAVVNLGHVRKTRSEPLVIRSAQRINSHAIQMVRDQHQTAGRHIRGRGCRRRWSGSGS